MTRITVRDLVRRVSERWEWQYAPGKTCRTPDKVEIGKKLAALPLNATPEDVKAIIGNYSWTRLSCDSCGHEVKAVVAVGNDHKTVYLCSKCIERAVKVIEDDI